jgi:hypothetical protein
MVPRLLHGSEFSHQFHVIVAKSDMTEEVDSRSRAYLNAHDTKDQPGGYTEPDSEPLAQFFVRIISRERTERKESQPQVNEEVLEKLASDISEAFQNDSFLKAVKKALNPIVKQVSEPFKTSLTNFMEKGCVQAFAMATVNACNRSINDLDFCRRFDAANSQEEPIQGVFSEFLEMATKLSELVICEMDKSRFSKIVPQADVGGVAGGEKFICKYDFVLNCLRF